MNFMDRIRAAVEPATEDVVEVDDACGTCGESPCSCPPQRPAIPPPPRPKEWRAGPAIRQPGPLARHHDTIGEAKQLVKDFRMAIESGRAFGKDHEFVDGLMQRSSDWLEKIGP